MPTSNILIYIGTAASFLFHRRNASDYVISMGAPRMKAITVCFWVKQNHTSGHAYYVSYHEAESEEGFGVCEPESGKRYGKEYPVEPKGVLQSVLCMCETNVFICIYKYIVDTTFRIVSFSRFFFITCILSFPFLLNTNPRHKSNEHPTQPVHNSSLFSLSCFFPLLSLTKRTEENLE